MKYYVFVLITLVLGSCQIRKHDEYLVHVEDYANALLENGRDTYGGRISPDYYHIDPEYPEPS